MFRSIVAGVSCVSMFAVVGCEEPPESTGPALQCRVDSECSGEMLCMDGLCVAPEPEESEGESDGDDDGESDGADDDGPGPSPGSPPTDDGTDDGPACGDPACQGDDAISVCQDGATTVYDCATVCSEGGLGPAAGCGVGEEGHDVCFCEPAPSCADAGESCSINGDCCEFGTTSAGCVAFPDGAVCADMCESNAGCVSDCCQPLTSNGVPTGFGACSSDSLCVQGTCGLPQCDYNFCGTESANDCPADWFGDGSCDCGCQFADIDCG